jgi:hypothetical protein
LICSAPHHVAFLSCQIKNKKAMLKMISWQTFLEVITVAVVVYYVVVTFVYYRSPIRAFLKSVSSKKKEGDNASVPLEATPQPNKKEEQIQDDFKLAATVSEQLKQVIQRTATDKVERQDVVESLRYHLQKYKHLRGTSYATAISNAIQRELKNHGQQLNEVELNSIWVEG